ncbi:P-loop containing nucleoside triphosphate hydrolase protein [Macrophomina phaseolina]|uniref:P-loop containing nucleoside triphosphate hydrolase protein n=1 Tax=Macrophomina phaseolina TaxID=35725 RepID=A0ABQ8FTH5_9PEZI|nr:P-loop containing nucleoside triphosphate hydrolase protein [Macrophomina phaseolina]
MKTMLSLAGKMRTGTKRLSEKDLLLLPKHVCAFALKRRAFAILNIDGLEPFVAQEKGWTELKLLKGHKDMVEAQAIKIQARERDIIRGKGQGLIILLHGFPGVGKTSTAECLAAKLGNPLYPITCGDLGTRVQLVEKRLEAIFSKAQKWNWVLLLDEADVFRAECTKTDIEPFLRTLEYYDGTLDEAFKSRIHMTLYYPPLKQAQMKAIWEVNLKRIQGYRDDIDPNINDILSYPDELWYQLEQEGRTQWNGRQIRNAF